MKPKRNVQRCVNPRVEQSAGLPRSKELFHRRSPRLDMLCLRKTCKGFCYIGEDSGPKLGARSSCKSSPMSSLAGLPLKIYFKDKWQFWSAAQLCFCHALHARSCMHRSWTDRDYLLSSRRSDDDSHWTSYRYAEAPCFSWDVTNVCKRCIMPVWAPNSESASGVLRHCRPRAAHQHSGRSDRVPRVRRLAQSLKYLFKHLRPR